MGIWDKFRQNHRWLNSHLLEELPGGGSLKANLVGPASDSTFSVDAWHQVSLASSPAPFFLGGGVSIDGDDLVINESGVWSAYCNLDLFLTGPAGDSDVARLVAVIDGDSAENDYLFHPSYSAGSTQARGTTSVPPQVMLPGFRVQVFFRCINADSITVVGQLSNPDTPQTYLSMIRLGDAA